MVRFYGHVLLGLDIIHALQDGQTMANTVYAHLLQFRMLQRNQRIAIHIFLCKRSASSQWILGRYIHTQECPRILSQPQARYPVRHLF